jgi:cephalosporin-C deacetylase-like acetyl esterase
MFNVVTPKRVALAIIVILCMAVAGAVHAQPQLTTVQVVVVPDKADWTYKNGEKVSFTATVRQYGNLLDGVDVRYEVREEKMKPLKSGTARLKNGSVVIPSEGMKHPGFLRCWVYADIDGKVFDGCGTAAFEPEKIAPTTETPDDFDAFWESAKAQLARIPMDVKMTLIPERCTEKINVYHVSLANYGNSRLYGILCVPKSAGTFPAILRVPGAGIRPYGGFTNVAEKGIITFEIGIHGVPVTMETGVYGDLSTGALSGYPTFNLDDRDRYYYKRVYLGCVRALDFISSLPEFRGGKIAVTGSSQGGALTIVSAALDSRVGWIGVYCPALCDVTGYLHGRAGGWPHMFSESNITAHGKPDKIETSKYYDVVNFARKVRVPGFFSWGFNDTTCPPTSMYSAYNVIDAPKRLFLVLDARHWLYPEQVERTNAWLENKLIGDGSIAP